MPLFARSLTYICLIVRCAEGGVLDVELIDIGEGCVGPFWGVGGAEYGIMVVSDEDDLGVEWLLMSPSGAWSWLVIAGAAEMVRCSS